ncbi:MAG: hypothetical protein AAB430_01445 [Patescibacteria group bacterium]
MAKMTQDNYYPNPDQYNSLPERFRPLLILENQIPGHSITAIEGTPLYVDQPWNDSHYFAYNEIMPRVKDILGRLFNHSVHLALIDDFTTDSHDQDRSFLDWMIHKPNQVFFESEFIESALNWITHWQQKEKTFNNKGRVWLNSNPAVPLTTESGRPSCELLDALFQNLKQSMDTNLIIHPTYFTDQQKGMRQILLAINKPLPFSLINVFFRDEHITQIIKTNPYGQTKRLY